MDNGDFKRKVPVGIRAVPGHVPSTVFNRGSMNDPIGQQVAACVEVQRTQRQERNSLRYEEKRRDMELLNNYNPWGKPGGGAPRQNGLQMNKLDQSLNVSDNGEGSFVDRMNKPGGGAPYRTVSGKPTGVMTVHADIRNNLDYMNEETKKKKSTSLPPPTGNTNGQYHKQHILSGRQKTSEEIKNNLKERLEKQIDEKRNSVLGNNEPVADPSSNWITGGKVGYVQRDGSGKIVRAAPLTVRDADGMREFVDTSGEKSIVEQMGRPGPGVGMRTESGKVQSQPRGCLTNYDDPFRPGRNISPAKQVFPVTIEHEAKERAWKRHPDLSPRVNKHTIENGYYTSDQNGELEEGKILTADKPLGTVHSAILRKQENYLRELEKQITEKRQVRQKARQHDLDQDYQHIKYSDCFGRPGNGAPRLMRGELDTTRKPLEELATHSEGFRNPAAFRGLYN